MQLVFDRVQRRPDFSAAVRMAATSNGTGAGKMMIDLPPPTVPLLLPAGENDIDEFFFFFLTNAYVVPLTVAPRSLSVARDRVDMLHDQGLT